MTQDHVDMFCKLTHEEQQELFNLFRATERDRQEEELRSKVKSHQQYVGKCYRKTVQPHCGMLPPQHRCFKVVSARASNEYRVSVLVVDEVPTYWFGYNEHRVGCAGDYFLGQFDLTSPHIDEVLCGDLVKPGAGFREVSEAEFNAAQVVDMKFSADHYRFGGKTPFDEGWNNEEMD